MAARCYTKADVLDKLQMKVRTFERLRKQGQLPFLEELRPRLGHMPRFRADLVDRYLDGSWGQSRSFRGARRTA